MSIISHSNNFFLALWTFKIYSLQFSSVTQSYPTLCNPMDCLTPDFLVHHQLPELAQTHVHRVSDAIQSSHPLSISSLLLLPSIFSNIIVFSNESVLHIRWPNYWSFSFSISPFNEYSGLISFRTDWSWESLGLQGFSNQSVLKELNPEYALEGLMLKLKLQ